MYVDYDIYLAIILDVFFTRPIRKIIFTTKIMEKERHNE